MIDAGKRYALRSEQLRTLRRQTEGPAAAGPSRLPSESLTAGTRPARLGSGPLGGRADQALRRVPPHARAQRSSAEPARSAEPASAIRRVPLSRRVPPNRRVPLSRRIRRTGVRRTGVFR